MSKLSPETVEFLLGVVSSLSLSASAPDFESTAALIVKAKRELAEQRGPAPTEVGT